MKVIKKINEGESWTAAIIGYKVIEYMGMDEKTVTKGYRIGIYVGFALIKIEWMRL